MLELIQVKAKVAGRFQLFFFLFLLCLPDFHRLYPTDEYEEELKVMAGVRSHFQVAYKVRYHHPSFPYLSFHGPDRIILPLAENHRPSPPHDRELHGPTFRGRTPRRALGCPGRRIEGEDGGAVE